MGRAIFFFIHKIFCCDFSLEVSMGQFTENSHHVFMKNANMVLTVFPLSIQEAVPCENL